LRDLNLLEHENKEDGSHHHQEADNVIPFQIFTQIKHREKAEDDQSNDFLHDLELSGAELLRPDAIGRDLEAILEKRDTPASKDRHPERDVFVLQMAIPGKRHEDVGNGQKDNRSHFWFPRRLLRVCHAIVASKGTIGM
jgi:hypothetical protein